jgi:hypothetical protein
MMRISNRLSRRAIGLLTCGVVVAVVGACNVKEELLAPQQPQVISPGDVQSATGAEGVYTGALGRFRLALNGGNNNQELLWAFEGLMTDEFKSGDTFSQRNDADQRQTQSNDGVLRPIYDTLQQSRGFARTAINMLTTFEPDQKTKIAEMYFMMGVMETQLGQAFCNGIPLGETVGGIPQYTAPLTNADVFKTAIARFDSALALLTGADAATANVRSATLVAKGKAQVDLGQFAAAATTVSPIPVGYQYLITYSQTTQDNEWWQMQSNTKRYSVGDSVDATGIVKNSLPFASAGDPRVPVTNTGKKSFDNTTPYFEAGLWQRDDAIALEAGLDAKLIVAEGLLQSSNFSAMTDTLNALRKTPPVLGQYKVVGTLAPLTAPASKDDAVNLFFREKAFWQFGRGERLSDMRRLIRQYGRTQDTVFPVGPFHKTGTYSTNVNFPVPDAEKTNTLFTGCIDRSA